jgi:hypothetical protein
MNNFQLSSSINLFKITVVLACFVLQGCSTTNNLQPESNLSDAEIYVANELPKEFDIKKIEYDLNNNGSLSFSNIAILKWKKEKGTYTNDYMDIQYYRASAIIFANINGEYAFSNGKYALVHINRFWTPEKQDFFSPNWMLNVVMDAPHKSYKVYATKPTKKDLAQFEKDTWWKGHSDNPDKLIDLGICFNNINEFLE